MLTESSIFGDRSVLDEGKSILVTQLDGPPVASSIIVNSTEISQGIFNTSPFFFFYLLALSSGCGSSSCLCDLLPSISGNLINVAALCYMTGSVQVEGELSLLCPRDVLCDGPYSKLIINGKVLFLLHAFCFVSSPPTVSLTVPLLLLSSPLHCNSNSLMQRAWNYQPLWSYPYPPQRYLSSTLLTSLFK